MKRHFGLALASARQGFLATCRDDVADVLCNLLEGTPAPTRPSGQMLLAAMTSVGLSSLVNRDIPDFSRNLA